MTPSSTQSTTDPSTGAPMSTDTTRRTAYQAQAEAFRRFAPRVTAVIESQVRESVAQEIEAWTEQYAMATGWVCDHDFEGATCDRCFRNARHASAVAARIARKVTP